MGMAYQGKDREDNFQVRYVVKTSGDRWFIPYNNNKTTAAQVVDCNTLCGVTDDDTACGSELVAS